MVQIEVNLVAVLLAAVASMIFGMIWYHPSVFGKKWMQLTGMKMKDMEKHKKKAGASMLFGLMSSIIMAYVLGYFISYAAGSATNAIIIGILAWAGFIATMTLGSVLWEGKSLNLYLFNNAHNLLSMVIMSIVLATLA